MRDRFDGRNPGGEVVRLYDARMGQEALALRRPSGTEPTIATRPVFSPDGLRLAVPAAPAPFGGDGVLRVYDLRTGQEALAQSTSRRQFFRCSARTVHASRWRARTACCGCSTRRPACQG